MNFLRSGHIDSFARDNLPPPEQWPAIDLAGAGLSYPERLNAVSVLVDDHVAQGRGDRPAIIGDHLTWSYRDLAERIDRIANVLTRDLGLVPGHRVLLRAANTPMMVAAYLAVIKAGGVVVATMPMLRAGELVYPLRKARIALALCDHRLLADLEGAQRQVPELARIVAFGAEGSELETLMAQPGYERFEAVDTASDDVCLIGFTSGTTGEPKGTMHFQRDLLVICDTYAAKVLKASPEDRFIGSAPLAFTFGLGGIVLFPFRIGAAAVLPDKTAPADLLDAIERHKASVIFTAPTAYRAVLDKLAGRDISSLRICVSAGETLPKPVFDAWLAKTGLKLMDGIGATEMLHIFIAAPQEAIRPVRPACRCRATRRRSSIPRGATCPTGRRAGSPCAGRSAAAISPMRASALTSRTAGTSPATPISAIGTAISGTRRARRHDRLVGLQHRRPGGGGLSARPSRRDGMRRGRRALPRARPHREGLCRAARGRRRRCGDAQDLAGSREGQYRALQISPRHRLRHGPAQDRQRQAAALRAAPDGAGEA